MINSRKQLRREQQLAKQKNDLAGTGSFLFVNNTKGDLDLPRPTKEGKKRVLFQEQFVGDSYYFGLLKTGDLRLVKELKDEKPVTNLFIFKNRTRDDLLLPHPSRDGLTLVPPLAEFVGDESFFELLKSGKLKLIKEVDGTMADKLLTEIPPTVTREGTVEYVKQEEEQLNEQDKKNKEKTEERSLEGVRLLLD